jgi:hypothetical protein
MHGGVRLIQRAVVARKFNASGKNKLLTLKQNLMKADADMRPSGEVNRPLSSRYHQVDLDSVPPIVRKT